jgi:hypothetical protein
MVLFLITDSAHALVVHVEKLANAEPDECFNGLGERVLPEVTDPFTCPDTGDPVHPEYAIPYTPQTYVWSLTQYGNSLWFGTGANILCITQAAVYSEVGADATGSSICEFGVSPLRDPDYDPYYPNLPEIYGDWRRARIYQYNLDTKELIDRTPPEDNILYILFDICLGPRSVGVHNGVVFFAGGTFFSDGLVMFAYNATTGEYLGSRAFSGYRSARKWKVIQGHLYTGVGTSSETDYSGRVLRWTGSVSDPFNFVEVGNLPNIIIADGQPQPAYGGLVRDLTEYIDGNGQSRIALTAKGVWLSPPIPPGGLTNTASGYWRRIWSPAEYEPDYVTRQTYAGGGIEFLNGWLYFMTMHIPGNAADVHENCYMPPLDNSFPPEYCFGETQGISESLAVSNATARATALWRIKNAESPDTRETQLLYGEAFLPQYQDGIYPGSSSNPFDAFPMVSTGYTPLLGSSGFDNDCNNYGWVMQVVGNYLFAGTMDYCTISNPGSISSGADLWRIDGTAGDVPLAAVPETRNAFKDFNTPGTPDIYHYSPYGFRNLIKSADGTSLYAGMATGVNVGAVGDGAGWQLLQLDLAADPPPFCAWDVEPEGGDADVDGLDLAAAAAMGLSPVQLDPSCQ